MPIPAGAIPTTDLDALADSPATARGTALFPVVTQFNQLIASANTATGMAVLDASGFLAGYGRLAAANAWAAAQTFNGSGNVFSSAAPSVRWRDTGQALPSGLFAWQCSGALMRLNRNTAAAGDFSTFVVPLQFDGADAATFVGTVSGANATAAGHLVNKGQLDSRLASFSASPGGATSIPNATSTKVNFLTEDWDTHGYYNPVTSTFSPAAGKYLVMASVGFQSGAVPVGTQFNLQILSAGGVNLEKTMEFYTSILNQPAYLNISTMLSFSAGMSVQIFARQTSGAALNTISGGASWRFQAHRIAD